MLAIYYSHYYLYCSNLLTDIEVFITPVEMDVLEGFSAVFECFAYGVHIEKLKWSRDFEPLHKDKVNQLLLLVKLFIMVCLSFSISIMKSLLKTLTKLYLS